MKKLIAIVVLGIILYILMKLWKKPTTTTTQEVISDNSQVADQGFNSGTGNTGGVLPEEPNGSTK